MVDGALTVLLVFPSLVFVSIQVPEPHLCLNGFIFQAYRMRKRKWEKYDIRLRRAVKYSYLGVIFWIFFGLLDHASAVLEHINGCYNPQGLFKILPKATTGCHFLTLTLGFQLKFCGVQNTGIQPFIISTYRRSGWVWPGLCGVDLVAILA